MNVSRTRTIHLKQKVINNSMRERAVQCAREPSECEIIKIMIETRQTAFDEDGAMTAAASEAQRATQRLHEGRLQRLPVLAVHCVGRPPVRPRVRDLRADERVGQHDGGADGKTEVRVAEAREKKGALLDFIQHHVCVLVPSEIAAVKKTEVFISVDSFDGVAVELNFC